MTIPEAVEEYLLERRVSKQYANQLRHRLRHFCDFVDCENLSALQRRDANRWIRSLDEESVLSAKTVKEYRSALLVLWKWLHEVGLVDERPERIRRVRVPKRTPVAWTFDELLSLLEVTSQLRRNVAQTDIPRRVWWTAFVHLAYATGLRLGDLLKLRWSDIRNDSVAVTQNKTGDCVMAPLSPSALRALDELPRNGDYVLPWPGTRSNVFKTLRTIVKRAGVRPGTSRWIRRSFASYIERDHPGRAEEALGHASRGLAQECYIDPTIAYPLRPSPPELKVG